MMRSIAVLTSLVLYGPSAAAEANSESVDQGTPCTTHTTGGDALDVECLLDAAQTLRRFHFKVNFSGGHDDTRASIKPTLDGAPLACEGGGKTSLLGEEGDISLECGFSIPGGPATTHVFKVKVLWSHAQYTDYRFGSDGQPNPADARGPSHTPAAASTTTTASVARASIAREKNLNLGPG